MKQHHRRRGTRSVAAWLFLAGVTASIILAANPAGAQEEIIVLGSGGSDELGPPPSPTCDDLVFITEVSFDAVGNPLDIPRFGTHPDLVRVFDVPTFEAVGPGVLELDEVILYDGHGGRDIWSDQLHEQVWFEFLLDGVQQATTPLTPDVPDGQLTGWLDVDMGSYALPNGADTLRIHHAEIEPAEINSVVVSALCGHLEPFADDASSDDASSDDASSDDASSDDANTDDASSDDAANDDANTDDASSDDASSDDANTDDTANDDVETEVQGQVEEPAPALAVTGRTQNVSLALALISIAFGALLVRVGSRERIV